MTDIGPEVTICACCGEASTQLIIRSYHIIGFGIPPSLDFRLGEWERMSVPFKHFVQECRYTQESDSEPSEEVWRFLHGNGGSEPRMGPGCGYCAPDISSAPEGVAEIIKSDVYKALHREDNVPDLVRKYRCWAYLAELTDKRLEAAIAFQSAAWAADDAGAETIARECRRKASLIYQALLESGEWSIEEEAGKEEAIVVDLMRRARMWEEAKEKAVSALSKGLDPIIVKILKFQLKLLEAGDDTDHTIEEVDDES